VTCLALARRTSPLLENWRPTAIAWERLAESATPFHQPEWFAAWWDAFGEGALTVFALEPRGEVTALLPLAEHGGRLRSPANWHTGEFGPVAGGRDDARAVFGAVFEAGARSVELDMMAPDTAGVAREAAREAGWRVIERTVARSPWVDVTGSWEEYELSLSRQRRKGLRRRRRQLEDPEGLETYLDEAFALEASGWKGRRGSAIVSRPDTLRFYRDFAYWAAERGWLRLAFLRIGDWPIAFDFGIEHRDTWYSCKAGYDEDFRRFGPGALLLHEELRLAFASDVRRFDLMGNVDSFKLGWTDRVEERTWLHAFSPTAAGRAEWAAVAAREQARRVVRRARQARRASTQPD
jgi:CelD/BcsL family acetyltransferase involved in cellulose biosynthesis